MLLVCLIFKHLPKLEHLRISDSSLLSHEVVQELKEFPALRSLEGVHLDKADEQELLTALPELFIYDP